MEEAQQIAQDFVSSLDNLPAEIKFIMEEIRLKEQETVELQASVNRKIQKANPRPHVGHSREPSTNLMERVQPELDRIDHLAQAKVALAQRLVALMTRTCGRLDHDVNRVRIASGEVPLTTDPIPPITPSASAASLRVADKVVDSMRTAIAIPEPAPSPPATAGGGSSFKRRRIGSTTGTVSNTPVVLSNVAPPPRQSRLSNTFNARSSPPSTSRRGAPSRPLQNNDATGEEHDEGDDPTDTEDKSLYCFCRKLSYGEMVGCDNDGCHYQWFHLACVGVTKPLPERWYCSECTRLLGLDTSKGAQGAASADERTGRKGRKK